MNNETVVLLTMDLLLNALNDASFYSSRLITKVQYCYSILQYYYNIGSHHTLVASELSNNIMERLGWGLKIKSKIPVHISSQNLWIFGKKKAWHPSRYPSNVLRPILGGISGLPVQEMVKIGKYSS